METAADEMLRSSTGYLFNKVNNRLQSALRHSLDELGITHPQFSVLASLKRTSVEKGYATQAQIARHAGMDEMTVSQMMRTLERRGLLARTPNPGDARARAVRLLPAGEAILARAYPVVRQISDGLFGRLEEQRAQFDAMLRALLSVPREEAAQGGRARQPEKENPGEKTGRRDKSDTWNLHAHENI